MTESNARAKMCHAAGDKPTVEAGGGGIPMPSAAGFISATTPGVASRVGHVARWPQLEGRRDDRGHTFARRDEANTGPLSRRYQDRGLEMDLQGRNNRFD